MRNPIWDVWPDEYAALVREAIAIRWLIYINGGNASKSVVEDVLLSRHGEIDRSFAHDIMNAIEQHDLCGAMFRDRRWYGGAEPAFADYPEIARADIRWYDGRPQFTEEA